MKYLIKKTYTATDNNPNFKGQMEVWYCGPNGASSKKLDWYVKEHPYKSKANLARGLQAQERNKEWEEKIGYWTIDLEVVEVEE